MHAVHWLVLLAAISLALTLLAHAATFFVLRARQKEISAPAISILKPLKGNEPGLYENLASLASQEYPGYEIIAGAADAGDPALLVALRVQADFPAARISVRSGERRLGLNPKVNLLAALAESAEHECWLISDSNVRAAPGYLRETAAELADPEVGLVTNLPSGAGEGLGALLEELHLGSFVASATSLARAAGGRACVIGKSMLFRRADFEKIGGFHAVRNVLAEDYVIGRGFELAGYKVALSTHVVTTMSDGWTVRRFVDRHVRWAQMRRRISPAAFLGELFLNPVLWLSLATLALGLELRFLALAAIGVGVKCAADALLLKRLSGRTPRASQVLLIPFKDLLVAGIWGVGLFRRSVNWRGNQLRIGQGSVLLNGAA
jgi:ceramide glucosyltransferase